MHLSQKGVPRIWLNQWVAESRSAKIEQATGQVQTANIKTRFQLKTRWRNVFLVVVETWTWLARAASTRISSSSPAPCPWGSSRTPRWRSLWWVLRWKQQGRWEILFLKQNVPSVSVHWILKYYMVCTCTPSSFYNGHAITDIVYFGPDFTGQGHRRTTPWSWY